MQHLSPKPSDKVPGLSQRNIDSILQLEQESLQERSALGRATDAISAFAGSLPFVASHAAALAAWVAVNVGLVPGISPFDPYPFVFLNLVLAVEAVFLSTFVLMSQNRQNHQADRWAHLDLQVSLLAEQETTKMLQMLQMICGRLGMSQVAHDRELKEMVQTTHVEVLSEELNQARHPQEEPPPEDPGKPAPADTPRPASV